MESGGHPPLLVAYEPSLRNDRNYVFNSHDSEYFIFKEGFDSVCNVNTYKVGGNDYLIALMNEVIFFYDRSYFVNLSILNLELRGFGFWNDDTRTNEPKGLICDVVILLGCAMFFLL